MALYKIDGTVGWWPVHALSTEGGTQYSTGVPPQLDEIKPCGTWPPSASNTSRYVNQHVAEALSLHFVDPTQALNAQ